MMQNIRWAFLILGVLVLIAVMVQNSHPASIKLFFLKTELPTSTLLLATSVLSFLLGALTTGRMLWQRGSGSSRPQEIPLKKP